MAKPPLSSIPEFYHKYVKLVEEDSATVALEKNSEALFSFLQAIPEGKWTFRYAEGKWSIKDLVQHMSDTERIFSYRALCIARGEKQSLPGFDENLYASNSQANRRNKADLVAEFNAVRMATSQLFFSFTEEQLSSTGQANNNPISVNGIGFITVGHVLHHLAILRERYLTA